MPSVRLVEAYLLLGCPETRYARPWRPVKPLEMICDVSARSVAHFEHWMCEVWPCRNLSVGAERGTVLVWREGSGAGVGERENGLEEGESAENVIDADVAAVLVLLWVVDEKAVLSEAAVDVDAVESDESWRTLRWVDLRRKEREGRR